MESFPQVSPTASGAPHTPPSAPTNDDIEAVIQMATSSRPSPDGRPVPARDTRTQLFVGNLPYRVRWQDLKDLFRKAGTVLRADVSLGPDNRSRGHGTVLYANAEDAGRAVDMFHGYSWQTRILEVRLDRLLPLDLDGNSAVSGGNGYAVPGLGSSPSILGMSSYAGAPLMGLGLSGSSNLDFGALYGLERPISTSNAGRNLFVGNLPFHCQWQDLKDLFRQAGAIVRADVALSAEGRSRGFGTVMFAAEADAERAVKMFNGYEYNGRVLKVHHDKFHPSSYPTTSNIGYVPSAWDPLPYADNTASFQSDPLISHSFQPVPTAFPNPIVGSSHYAFGATPVPSVPFDSYLAQHGRSQTPLSQPQFGSHLASNDYIPSSLHDLSPAMSNANPTGSTPPRSPILHPPPRPRPHQHHAHPGPISIPPPPPVAAFPSPPHAISPHPHSPLQHPHPHSPIHPFAHGLPPITPSMPPFNFFAQPSPRGYPHDSNLSQHSTVSPANSPRQNGLRCSTHILNSFSPVATMSPGAFFGRPGAGVNPFINTAVGAPVHNGPPIYDSDTSGLNQGLSHTSPGTEPTSYFPPVPVEEGPGYFPSMPSSGVANEILREKEKEMKDGLGGWLGEKRDDAAIVPSPLETDERASGTTAGPWGGASVRGRASDGQGEADTRTGDSPSLENAGARTTSMPSHSSSLPSKISVLVPAQRSESDPLVLANA